MQSASSLGRADPDASHWDLEYMECPDCGRLVVRLRAWQGDRNVRSLIVYPTTNIRPIPEQITGEFREDFEEACAVLDRSPKASAALSRRLLQHVLREKAGVRERTLDQEIEKVIADGHLPRDLAEDLDALRNVGNIAAHPIKSGSTGEIVSVEHAEAEWLLDLAEEVLDHYIVRPAIREERRVRLNEKLADANKPPLKEASAE